MLLREINIGSLTVIVEEEQNVYEIKAFGSTGERIFMHIYHDYEIVKSAMDSITAIMEKGGVTDEDIVEILRLSKDK